VIIIFILRKNKYIFEDYYLFGFLLIVSCFGIWILLQWCQKNLLRKNQNDWSYEIVDIYKLSIVQLVTLYLSLFSILIIGGWIVCFIGTLNKLNFIMLTVYYGGLIIFLTSYLFRRYTLNFAYEYENEIKLLGPFMRLFLYIFTTRFFYGANGNRTMKAIYIFCFQASLISFYVSFTIRNYYLIWPSALLINIDNILHGILKCFINCELPGTTTAQCRSSSRSNHIRRIPRLRGDEYRFLYDFTSNRHIENHRGIGILSFLKSVKRSNFNTDKTVNRIIMKNWLYRTPKRPHKISNLLTNKFYIPFKKFARVSIRHGSRHPSKLTPAYVYINRRPRLKFLRLATAVLGETSYRLMKIAIRKFPNNKKLLNWCFNFRLNIKQIRVEYFQFIQQRTKQFNNIYYSEENYGGKLRQTIEKYVEKAVQYQHELRRKRRRRWFFSPPPRLSYFERLLERFRGKSGRMRYKMQTLVRKKLFIDLDKIPFKKRRRIKLNNLKKWNALMTKKNLFSIPKQYRYDLIKPRTELIEKYYKHLTKRIGRKIIRLDYTIALKTKLIRYGHLLLPRTILPVEESKTNIFSPESRVFLIRLYSGIAKKNVQTIWNINKYLLIKPARKTAYRKALYGHMKRSIFILLFSTFIEKPTIMSGYKHCLNSNTWFGQQQLGGDTVEQTAESYYMNHKRIIKKHGRVFMLNMLHKKKLCNSSLYHQRHVNYIRYPFGNTVLFTKNFVTKKLTLSVNRLIEEFLKSKINVINKNVYKTKLQKFLKSRSVCGEDNLKSLLSIRRRINPSIVRLSSWNGGRGHSFYEPFRFLHTKMKAIYFDKVRSSRRKVAFYRRWRLPKKILNKATISNDFVRKIGEYGKQSQLFNITATSFLHRLFVGYMKSFLIMPRQIVKSKGFDNLHFNFFENKNLKQIATRTFYKTKPTMLSRHGRFKICLAPQNLLVTNFNKLNSWFYGDLSCKRRVCRYKLMLPWLFNNSSKKIFISPGGKIINKRSGLYWGSLDCGYWFDDIARDIKNDTTKNKFVKITQKLANRHRKSEVLMHRKQVRKKMAHRIVKSYFIGWDKWFSRLDRKGHWLHKLNLIYGHRGFLQTYGKNTRKGVGTKIFYHSNTLFMKYFSKVKKNSSYLNGVFPFTRIQFICNYMIENNNNTINFEALKRVPETTFSKIYSLYNYCYNYCLHLTLYEYCFYTFWLFIIWILILTIEDPVLQEKQFAGLIYRDTILR